MIDTQKNEHTPPNIFRNVCKPHANVLEFGEPNKLPNDRIQSEILTIAIIWNDTLLTFTPFNALQHTHFPLEPPIIVKITINDAQKDINEVAILKPSTEFLSS